MLSVFQLCFFPEDGWDVCCIKIYLLAEPQDEFRLSLFLKGTWIRNFLLASALSVKGLKGLFPVSYLLPFICYCIFQSEELSLVHFLLIKRFKGSGNAGVLESCQSFLWKCINDLYFWYKRAATVWLRAAHSWRCKFLIDPQVRASLLCSV